MLRRYPSPRQRGTPRPDPVPPAVRAHVRERDRGCVFTNLGIPHQAPGGRLSRPRRTAWLAGGRCVRRPRRERLAAAIAGIEAEDTGTEQERAALAALAADRAQLVELATAYGEHLVTFAEFLAARKPIEARIERAERRLSQLTRTAPVAAYVGHSDALRQAWRDLPLPRQRAIVAAVLDRATIRPATPGRRRLDPDRIEPVWRV